MRQTNGLRQRRMFRVHLAAALLGAAGAAWAQSCAFRNPLPGPISFGALDPSIGTARNATSNFRVQCTAAISPAWSFSGANGNAPLRMKHVSASAYIPYSAAASSSGGPPGNQQWVVTATVLGTDYINALVGDYSDTLTATINP